VKKSILLFIPFQIFAAANYYCGTDQGYIKYIQGAGNLDGVANYQTKDNCLSNCKTYNYCSPKSSTTTIFAVEGQIKLGEADKIKFEGLLSGRSLSNILINANGNAGLYDFSSSPISGTSFKFPTVFSSDPLNPVISNIIYSNGTDSISLKSVQDVTSYQATCDSNNTLSNGLCKRDDNSTYSPKCSSGGSLSNGNCYKLSGTNYYQVGAMKNGLDISMPTTSTYIDQNTEQVFNSVFFFNAEAVLSGYTCTKLKGQIQNGDLGHNFFSLNNECEANCAVQNDCFAVSEEEEGCEVTDIQYSNPVTDYTGKTVYSGMSKTLKCTTKTTKQTGCSAYKISNSYNTVNYDLSSIGYRYNTYSGLEEAAATSLMTEQMQHLFSGWKGKCEHGMKFDNPFNDPMKILSYALMVYSAAGTKMFEGTAIGKVHDAIESTFSTAADETAKAMTALEQADVSSFTELSGYGASIMGTYTNLPMESIADIVSRYNTAWETTLAGVNLTLKWSAIAEAALAIAFPEEEEYVAADNLLKAWMGSSDADTAALAYVQCMASIGLSFPNMASWSASDVNGMSSELQSPLLNPIRLTDAQVATLIAATSEKFVKTTLLPISVSGDDMTYIALSSTTYYQVGQVICGGELAVAENYLTAASTTSSTSGSADYTMVGLKLLISTLPPPANLIASLIVDIVTSFESGNACTDQEIALKWGVDQYKTNMFVNYDQCHYVSTKCVAKWFWGSCMRKQNSYCCYDQILTRVMMEGIKTQLGRDWSNCSDVSINDLKNISFIPCKANQDPYLDHCFPKDKYDEFISAMKVQASKGLATQTMQDVVDQAVNSMAIPGKNLEEICTDCTK